MKNKKIYIAGHNGMVGSAIYRSLVKDNFNNIITIGFEQLDLTRQEKVEQYFSTEKPEIVIVAAAKVGGILANNTYRAEFIYDNLMIETNLIHSSQKYGVEKLIFLGSSCIYPKLAEQPLKEEYLLSNYLEYTNEPYAIAKIAGIKLCENYYKQYNCNFFSVMPTNLYGPNDNYNLNNSHVLPALIRKIYEAKIKMEENTGGEEVVIWGTGSPKREFLYVEDLADAVVYLLKNIDAQHLYDKGITHLNIGTGEDLTIGELAEKVKNIIGYNGKLIYDKTKPDGTPRKLLDVTRINNLGWKHKTTLDEGIKKSFNWFIENQNKYRD